MNLQNLRLSDISISCLIRSVLRNLWMVVVAAAIFAMSVSLALEWIYVPAYNGNMTYAVTTRKTSYATGNNASSMENNTGSIAPTKSAITGVICAIKP